MCGSVLMSGSTRCALRLCTKSRFRRNGSCAVSFSFGSAAGSGWLCHAVIPELNQGLRPSFGLSPYRGRSPTEEAKGDGVAEPRLTSGGRAGTETRGAAAAVHCYAVHCSLLRKQFLRSGFEAKQGHRYDQSIVVVKVHEHWHDAPAVWEAVGAQSKVRAVQ